MSLIELLLLLLVTFMQDVYNYIPEANQVSRAHSVAAVLHLQSVLFVMFFPILNDLYLALVLHELCVQCPIRAFTVVP